MILIASGVVVLIHAFVRFVAEGAGTPAPVAPTEHLVVGGLYRYVRNPMYLAVVATIVGQALVLGQTDLLLYATAVGFATGAFAHWYEEPALQRRFGAQYDAYRRAVPAWWPRLRPWNPDDREVGRVTWRWWEGPGSNIGHLRGQASWRVANLRATP